MKKIVSFLLVIAISVCIFASCSNGDNKNNSPTETESTTEANTETVTIVSRNNQEPLEIVYDNQVLSQDEVYSSEVRFWVSDAIL
jgi:hypothetical protein